MSNWFWDRFQRGESLFTRTYKKGEALPVIGQTVPQEWYDSVVKERDHLLAQRDEIVENLRLAQLHCDDYSEEVVLLRNELAATRKERDEYQAQLAMVRQHLLAFADAGDRNEGNHTATEQLALNARDLLHASRETIKRLSRENEQLLDQLGEGDTAKLEMQLRDAQEMRADAVEYARELKQELEETRRARDELTVLLGKAQKEASDWKDEFAQSQKKLIETQSFGRQYALELDACRKARDEIAADRQRQYVELTDEIARLKTQNECDMFVNRNLSLEVERLTGKKPAPKRKPAAKKEIE